MYYFYICTIYLCFIKREKYIFNSVEDMEIKYKNKKFYWCTISKEEYENENFFIDLKYLNYGIINFENKIESILNVKKNKLIF